MKIVDDKLFKILTNRKVIFDEIQEINKKMIALDTDRKKLGYKMDALKEKTKKIIDGRNIPLEEFQYIANIAIENGEIEVTIKDQVEDYKELVREQKAKEKK